MIQYDENTFYLIGGWQDDKISANTHILERVSQDKWDVYPWGPLKHARMGHSCAKMDRNARGARIFGPIAMKLGTHDL